MVKKDSKSGEMVFNFEAFEEFCRTYGERLLELRRANPHLTDETILDVADSLIRIIKNNFRCDLTKGK